MEFLRTDGALRVTMDLEDEVARTTLSDLPDVELLDRADAGRPDVVLADVPDRSSRRNGGSPTPGAGGAEPAVVLVGAEPAGALDAFAHGALDYLVRPIDPDRLRDAMARARERVQERRDATLGRRLRSFLDRAPVDASSPDDAPVATPSDDDTYPERFRVRERGRIYFVRSEDVRWVEASGQQVVLHTDDGPHPLRTTMREMEASLDPRRWVRIHRSAIVHVDHIAEIHPHLRGDYRVFLRSGEELPLSRRRRAAVDRLLG